MIPGTIGTWMPAARHFSTKRWNTSLSKNSCVVMKAAPSTDGKTGPAALGSVADLAKKDDAKKDDKPLAPEFETIPAGPVFAFVAHSDSSAAINGLMSKRAFQIAEYTFTGLPQKSDELFEAAPPPSPAAAPATPSPAPAAEPKK